MSELNSSPSISSSKFDVDLCRLFNFIDWIGQFGDPPLTTKKGFKLVQFSVLKEPIMFSDIFHFHCKLVQCVLCSYGQFPAELMIRHYTLILTDSKENREH